MIREILRNKNCFLTGATGGIGIEVAKLLAKNNCNIFLTSRDKEKLQKLKIELEHINSTIKINYEIGDFNDLNDISKIIKRIKENFESIDILINCAGIFVSKSIYESTIQDFEKCFNVNVKALFLFCKEFSQNMIDKKWGRIINIGSSSSYFGYANGTIYCASKHSILGLSRSLHDELKKHNVRVFCVSPGSIKTNMGKLSTDQDFNTFLDPREVAEFIIFQMSFDKELICEESRLNRMEFR